MQNLSVVIVGGGSGLGALLARMAVDAGARAIGIIDLNAEAADAAPKPARDKGVTVAMATADIQNGPASHAAFAEVAGALGRVDTLINCAAIYPRRPIMQISDADWDASNGINIKGTYHMMVAAAEQMRGQDPKDHGGSATRKCTRGTSSSAPSCPA